MPEFHEYPSMMWGMALFRELTNLVLRVKIANMQDTFCTTRYDCGINWEEAAVHEYAEQCPYKRLAKTQDTDECDRWKECEVGILFRKIAEDTEDVVVKLAVLVKIRSLLRQYLSSRGSEKDEEGAVWPTSVVVMDYADGVRKKIRKSTDAISVMVAACKDIISDVKK